MNTFWELGTRKAQTRKVNDGWLVNMDVQAKKVRVDARGTVTEAAMNDLIEIGVFAAGPEDGGKPLYLKKHRIISGNNHITITVSGEPDKAGIDPRNLLIDTEVHNNIRQVDFQ